MRFLAGLWLAASCAAQAAPKPAFSEGETRRITYDYARCVVNRSPAQARKVILANLDNSTIINKHGDLISSECLVDVAKTGVLGVEMRMPGDTFRFALADALFSLDLRGSVPVDVKSAAPLQHRVFDENEFKPKPGKTFSKRRAEKAREDRDNSLASAFLATFGECVVRSDSNSAHALLMTVPSSPEEREAFTALKPAFGGCLTNGGRFKVDRMMMRGAVAHNYYRLALAPKKSPTAGVSR